MQSRVRLCIPCSHRLCQSNQLGPWIGYLLKPETQDQVRVRYSSAVHNTVSCAVSAASVLVRRGTIAWTAALTSSGEAGASDMLVVHLLCYVCQLSETVAPFACELLE